MEVDSRLLCIAPRKLEPCACRTQQALGRRALDTNPSPRYSSPHGRPLRRFSVQASPLGFATRNYCRRTGQRKLKPVYARSEDRPVWTGESGAVSALDAIQMARAAGPRPQIPGSDSELAADLLVVEHMRFLGRLAHLFDGDRIEIGEKGFARLAHGRIDHALEQDRVGAEILRIRSA